MFSFTDRFVGWLKNFIHNRYLATENMMNGYGQVTLTRAAPEELRQELLDRNARLGLKGPSGSYVARASDKLARRAGGGGLHGIQVPEYPSVPHARKCCMLY